MMQREGNHEDVVPDANDNDEPCGPNKGTWIAISEVVNLGKLLMFSQGNSEIYVRLKRFPPTVAGIREYAMQSAKHGLARD